MRRSKLLDPPAPPPRVTPVEDAILEVVDRFYEYGQALERAVERMQDLNQDDIWPMRQWLLAELRLHLWNTFERLPRCWPLGLEDDRPRSEKLFDQWYAGLDAIIGPTDPRDIAPPETE